MKNITLFFLILVSTAAYCQKGPKIEFSAPDNTIDYGQISKADITEGTFEFKNTGDAPLLITGAASTAGYIMVTKPVMAIMPGKKGKISIKYKNMPTGPIRKTIIVESNAVNEPGGRVGLKIKGEVL
ncbi:DUF1573 domain-containing protein [Flavobacterium aquidurense]|uniref:DUF1573 domain-containing protein n=1 Tax=Flavobacterium piscisymbiosum TaxID=2893753 RepID=A0ABS8MHR4_9FLAO|nr:DUF1573 domain-containing protein [Flavobacterium sp. F-30]MCC9065033.1 DUF1573 domain-containing protein [Flavobacterium sp. F-30]